MDLPFVSTGSRLEIVSQDSKFVEFDLVNVNNRAANLLLQTMLYEIPTVAMEVVYIRNNTSLLPSEQLSQRIAMLPIKADPMLLKERANEYDEFNSLIFDLKVCRPAPGDPIPSGFLISNDGRITSDMVRWIPWGNQEQRFRESRYDPEVRMVDSTIHLTDLDIGRTIDLTCYAYRGTARKHRKWAAIVQTMFAPSPRVTIVNDVVGQSARSLVKVCPVNVFSLNDMEDLLRPPTPSNQPLSEPRAIVLQERNCWRCGACTDPVSSRQWAPGQVVVTTRPNHFIFRVESIGQLPAPLIFQRAMELFRRAVEVGGK